MAQPRHGDAADDGARRGGRAAPRGGAAGRIGLARRAARHGRAASSTRSRSRRSSTSPRSSGCRWRASGSATWEPTAALRALDRRVRADGAGADRPVGGARAAGLRRGLAPSDALAAVDAADEAFTGLLLALGSIALLVGGIGVANTMIIAVIERRREIGLRRAIGATRAHIRRQFLAEALVLSAIGGAAGVALGAAVTAVAASLNGWVLVIPPTVVALGAGATIVVGGVAGLRPAVRAARTPPSTALNG